MISDTLPLLPAHLVDAACELDRTDPLAAYRDEFLLPDDVVAYLDGNSLGRPLRGTGRRLNRFVEKEWGERLIRAWDEGWMSAPARVGDLIADAVLDAGSGQVVVADSTSVMIYKLAHAAITARPGRTEIVADAENFPTDRYILASIAEEFGLTVRWITPDPAAGVQLEEVQQLLSERTTLVALSHVAYKSSYICDLPGITAAAHRVGALVLWDLCHSAGVLQVGLDDADVDLAVGCTYKYLNGGPGAPAFAYVNARLQDELSQPITGWIGHATPFAMGPSYEPATGIRRMLSGTPSILAMLPVEDMVQLIQRAGIPFIREKSVRLTEFALRWADETLTEFGVVVASPREATTRGGHVTFEHPRMEGVVAELWQGGIIPDFRPPSGLRVGLSPLSTSFMELSTAMGHVRAQLARTCD